MVFLQGELKMALIIILRHMGESTEMTGEVDNNGKKYAISIKEIK